MMIERSRRYTDQGCPMPLNIADVNAYLACLPMPIPLEEFMASLFVIDDVWLEKRYKRMKEANADGGT